MLLSKNIVCYQYMTIGFVHASQSGHQLFPLCSLFLHTFYAALWYHIHTEEETVGKADAVEISADDPTADS